MNSTNKILSIAVALLLLTNIALVYFMVKGRSKHGPSKRREPIEMMKKELNMTDEQVANYKAQKEDHLKNIRPLFDSLKSAKTALFGLVKDPAANDSLVNAYSQKICDQQTAIDKLTYDHFKKVRNLFTPEQQPKFDEFVQKMMQRGRRDSAGKKDNR